MVDFASYVPPDVYVDAGATPTLVPVGIDPTVICLIGSGVGYHTFSETVSFASTTSAVLTQKGINAASIVVTGYVTDPNASGQSIPHTFVKDDTSVPHDYSITTDTTAGVDKSVTTITKSSGGAIEVGFPQVTVTYKYTDVNYHSLNYFEDFASFQDTYGPALDPATGNLVSPLSMAAQVAIQNGAQRIYAIALDTTQGTVANQFAQAYQLLAGSNTSVNVVVPLWDGITSLSALGGMLATLNAALLADANNRALRMAIVGFDQSVVAATSDVVTLASVASKRIVLAWPNQLNYYNGYTNSTSTLDGFYLAAAYAGVLARQTPQMPLTRKYLAGFSGIPTTVQQALTTPNKNTLASAGVTVTEVARNGALIIRHGLTTNYAGGVLTREISLVRAQDSLYNLLEDSLQSAGLIGIPIDDNTALSVKSIVSGALETAKSTGVINDYNNLAVREQNPPSGDPTVIEVMFAYKPTWPLNYILVNFTVDTTSGSTDLTSTSTAA